ncbi:MAG: hypothetical protein ABI480_06140 [Chitinophagaceae bacterium]
MSPRNLFNIILKILGLFFLKDFITAVADLLNTVIFLTNPESRTVGIWYLLSELALMIVYWFVGYYLIFKSELIIDQLKLDKGFDTDTIPLNAHRSTILSIAVIVIGGLMTVYAIPDFCRQLYLYIIQNKMTYGITKSSMSNFISPAAKIVVGIFLMNGQRKVVNFIEYRRKK